MTETAERRLEYERLRNIADKMIDEHGVRRNFRPHVLSILRWAKDEQQLQDAMFSLHRHCRRWFY